MKKLVNPFSAPVDDVAQDIMAVCDDVSRLLITKNKSYGNSALNPVRVFSRLDTVEGLKVRIDDKLSRLARGDGAFGEDTVLDLLGYLVLLRVAQKRAAREKVRTTVVGKE